MKLTLIILTSLLLSGLSALPQQNIVILVDVSGSIPQLARTQTKNVLKDILMGKPISDPSFYYEKDPNSSLNINGTPLVSNGSQVLLIPFGDKSTSDKYAEIKVSNYPGDLLNFIDINYPTVFSDGFTYLTLAKAKAAQLAKQKGISRFMLLLISDNISDFTGGKSPNYTTYEQQLVDNYNSQSNPITEGGVDGYVKLRGNSDFKIPIRTMDVSKYQAIPNPSQNPPTTTPATPANTTLSIEFTGALAAATRKKPAVIKSNNVTVSWQCRNCPDNMRYNLIFTQIEGGKFRDANSKNISTPSVLKKLESGVYKITVSGEVPYRSMPVSGAITYVSVETGSGSWWLWVLLLAGLIGLIIYMNKENQKKKIRKEGKERSSILDSNPGKDKPFTHDEF
ncbi:MAG: hypothetical protein WCF67_14405 [Chitinophagaceae bacterium]